MMSILINDNPPSIWSEVCEEFQRLDPLRKTSKADEAQTVKFDSRVHHPAVFGRKVSHDSVDSNPLENFLPAKRHPAFAGLVEIQESPRDETEQEKLLPEAKTCSPREYLEAYVYPTLLPGLLELLKTAKDEKCFERKFFKFNGCDFLTEYLYNNNPKSVKIFILKYFGYEQMLLCV